MKVSVRFNGKTLKKSSRSKTGGIVIKRLGKSSETHVAGTVVLKKVHFGRTLLGDVVEETEDVLTPKAEDGMFSLAVKNWPRARFISSLGGYYNLRTGERVSNAEYVYMAGNDIYYTN
jgi:hypothetical protein